MPLTRKEKSNCHRVQEGLDSRAPRKPPFPRPNDPTPSFRPAPSRGALLERSPRWGRAGSHFPLEIQRLQEPARSLLPRGWWAVGQVPKVLWPGTRQTGNSTCRASAPARKGQWSGPLAKTKHSAAEAGAPARTARCTATPGLRGPDGARKARVARPRPGPLRAAAATEAVLAAPPPRALALAHLRPRAVLESRAEVLGAPCALAAPIALHGPGGRSRFSEASSPRATGSHRRRGTVDAGRWGRGAGDVRSGEVGERTRSWRAAVASPAPGGGSRPHSSCPAQVVSGCGLPGPAPSPAALARHLSQAGRPFARSRLPQSLGEPPPLW